MRTHAGCLECPAKSISNHRKSIVTEGRDRPVSFSPLSNLVKPNHLNTSTQRPRLRLSTCYQNQCTPHRLASVHCQQFLEDYHTNRKTRLRCLSHNHELVVMNRRRTSSASGSQERTWAPFKSTNIDYRLLHRTWTTEPFSFSNHTMFTKGYLGLIHKTVSGTY